MKTIEKKGLQCMAKEAGLDLYSLPYVDARPERQEWLAKQPKHPPMVGALLETRIRRETPIFKLAFFLQSPSPVPLCPGLGLPWVVWACGAAGIP